MNKIFKVLGVVFAALFIWAAVVQHNDPDSTRWYIIYGMAAFASLLFASENLRFMWAVILFLFYAGFTIYSWPEKFEGVTIGEGDIMNIERGREALGMAITALIMLLYAFRIKKS
ncbi:transmembrane 220 family protein [Flagellimonas lutaonensis]|uniref:Transmembrane family 220, helix n=1 Tax=Flagellimonas lutaonensis TaxID=516051 RepID=A0A0D5YQ38_9FLAO|nr:transmembrane 220 family protein [Allomuricauda lutaonensis]AKA33988.1 hypothetical protein VC82_302 [Allomuricauda lutaonensis]